jgi:DNA-binding GntR family transcriptional regulator
MAIVIGYRSLQLSADIVRLARPDESDLPSKAIVADEIRCRITTGRLALGARISDKQLAAELEVSRTPVREALVQLQSEGLVVMRPQSGTFVVDLTVEDVRQICATRAILETGALRLAAETGSAEPMARLGFLVGRAAIALDDGDLALCDELDCQFHEGVVAASGNGYLIRAYSGISDRLRALRQRLPREKDRMARAIAQHRHIIDLWAAGRLDQAIAEIGAHVGNVARLLTAVRAGDSSTA